MRYRLRTLLILLALGPPVLAGTWWGWQRWRDSQRTQCQPAFRALAQGIEISVPAGSEGCSDEEFSFFVGFSR
jgi:hypothetical protein